MNFSSFGSHWEEYIGSSFEELDMVKPSDPRQLAIDLLPRSICAVQVAAVIVDWSGRIVGWGWNNVGTGMGIHAEPHAISRTNRDRLGHGATVFVAAKRNRNYEKLVTAKPCEACQLLINKYGLRVVYRDQKGEWCGG